MAFKLFKRDNFHYGVHQEFFIDDESDLEQIEKEYNCELGDKAYTPDGAKYVRHSDDYKITIVPHQFAPHNDDISEEMELPSYLPINVDLTQFTPGTEIIVNWNGETHSVTIAEENYYHFIGYRDYENPTFEIGYFTNGLANGQLIFAYGYNSPVPENVELTVTTSNLKQKWERLSEGSLPNATSDTIVLHMDENTYTLDKTWQEITDLLAAGKRLVFFNTNTQMFGAGGGTQATVIATSSLGGTYAVWSFGYLIDGGQPQWYDFRAFADTANDYPYVD